MNKDSHQNIALTTPSKRSLKLIFGALILDVLAPRNPTTTPWLVPKIKSLTKNATKLKSESLTNMTQQSMARRSAPDGTKDRLFQLIDNLIISMANGAVLITRSSLNYVAILLLISIINWDMRTTAFIVIRFVQLLEFLLAKMETSLKINLLEEAFQS
jgi:hypothetical protein